MAPPKPTKQNLKLKLGRTGDMFKAGDASSISPWTPRRQVFQNKEQSFLAVELCDWMSDTLDIEMNYGSLDSSCEDLCAMLGDGVVICRFVEALLCEHVDGMHSKAKVGSFHARENVELAMELAESLGVNEKDTITYEHVSQRNYKAILSCFLELARVGMRYGINPPPSIVAEQKVKEEKAAKVAAKANGLAAPPTPVAPAGLSIISSLPEATQLEVAEQMSMMATPRERQNYLAEVSASGLAHTPDEAVPGELVRLVSMVTPRSGPDGGMLDAGPSMRDIQWAVQVKQSHTALKQELSGARDEVVEALETQAAAKHPEQLQQLEMSMSFSMRADQVAALDLDADEGESGSEDDGANEESPPAFLKAKPAPAAEADVEEAAEAVAQVSVEDVAANDGADEIEAKEKVPPALPPRSASSGEELAAHPPRMSVPNAWVFDGMYAFRNAPRFAQAKECRTCDKRIGVRAGIKEGAYGTTRRHCRYCGDSFCIDHASKSLRVPFLQHASAGAQRVCDGCWGLLTGEGPYKPPYCNQCNPPQFANLPYCMQCDAPVAPEKKEAVIKGRTVTVTVGPRPHCHCCGFTFCGDCSSNTAKIPFKPRPGYKGPQRVCDGCFALLSIPDGLGNDILVEKLHLPIVVLGQNAAKIQ